MSSRPKLKLDWCTHEAAKYAVENWHYSKSMPSAGVKIGVWENDLFIGVVLFGVGAGCSTDGRKYGLSRSHDIAELVRIALRSHKTPVSRIVAIAIKMLCKQSPKLKMIISFADPFQNHHGGIYQAGNWIYTGDSAGDRVFVVHGKRTHPKTIHSLGWMQQEKWLKNNVDPHARLEKVPGKHRYLMPLDDEIRQRIEPLRKPYPKRVRSEDSGTVGIQPIGGGANPTRTLKPVSR